MNISEDYQIAYARLNSGDIFVVTDIEKGQYHPLTHTEPKGIYTMDPNALYAGQEYLIGVRPSNINLAGMLNIYQLEIDNAFITKEPIYYADLDLIVTGVKFRSSVIPKLNEMSLPDSLWSVHSVFLYINDIAVTTDDGDIVKLPVSFNPGSATPDGDKFFNSDHAIMVVQPGENLLLDITSGSGAGAGVNLVKGENKSGGNGGDATLCYIDPMTGEVKPIVFIEGGLGGRLSSNAFQEFKPRSAKIKTFMDGWVNPYISINVLEMPHNLPINDLQSTEGGQGHLIANGSVVVTGGNGGIKDDIGHRGEGGMSGGRAVVQIIYQPAAGTIAGPFIVVHPKTMVNIFGVIKDKDLKIKKTKKPMVGGLGGSSLTQSGEDGQNGTLIVSACNG